MAKNKENKNKGFITRFKETWNDPRGKGMLFFAFYFVFFIIVIAMLRGGSDTTRDEDKVKNNFDFNFSKIEEKNYHFKYSYTIAFEQIIYEGNRNNRNETFTKTTNIVENFEKEKDRYYQIINNDRVEVVNPYYYSDFLDIDIIKELIKKATYVSKTEYDNGRVKYSYQISTTTLLEIVDNEIADLDDPINIIEVVVDKNNQVSGIHYDLSSYSKYKEGIQKMEIKLEYTSFGKVEEKNIE